MATPTAPLISSKDIKVTYGGEDIEFIGTFPGLPSTQENTSIERETSERSIVKNVSNKKWADYALDIFLDNTVRQKFITDKESNPVPSKPLVFASTLEGATFSESYMVQVKNVESDGGDVAEDQPGFTVTFTINSRTSGASE